MLDTLDHCTAAYDLAYRGNMHASIITSCEQHGFVTNLLSHILDFVHRLSHMAHKRHDSNTISSAYSAKPTTISTAVPVNQVPPYFVHECNNIVEQFK